MAASNGQRTLIFVCDGTLASQHPGEETNARLFYLTVRDAPGVPMQEARYDAGIQSEGLRRWIVAATGEGINRSIRRGYGWLANRYRPGDRIFLFGYSRGAYAVRSLAGMIGRIGLLRPAEATHRNVRLAFRHYERTRLTGAARLFMTKRCQSNVAVEMLGVWDTVRALGLPYPFLARLHPATTDFHHDGLAAHIRHGYHALAIDEDRPAYAPILWSRSDGWEGRLEQAWFPGTHADVGGEVRTVPDARGLSNISLNWMLRRANSHGVALPPDWRERFPENAAAPAVGNRRGNGLLFWVRTPRRVGGADGETLHLSIRDRAAALPGYQPRAVMVRQDEERAATA